ncbi:hypothetical protein [Maribacter aestuarii]|uniref:hypothetical protein n=1 Tax=Maribacter aestuarii TaxID=1130723 RepID=UPI00248BD307|nr:hypothetical protein [Maribacter aestuarii]
MEIRLGGYNDADEVLVYGNYTGPEMPMYSQATGEPDCAGCDFQNVPKSRRSTWSDLTLPLRWNLDVSDNSDGCH